MSLTTTVERVNLETAAPFTIARGTTTTTTNVVVTISDGTYEGVGAAAPSARYGETAETVETVLPDLLDVVEDVGDPHCLDRIEREIDETVRRNPAAKAAIDIALHDIVCKRLDVPLYRYLGLDADEAVSTSYTVGIADTEVMAERAKTAVDEGFSVLKIKLGTDRDREIVDAVRSVVPEARIRVDANEAWRPREAVRTMEALAAYDIEFVEQPVAADNSAGMRFVHERAPLPVAADESCVNLEDVPAIAEYADIANLKLMKCGGLRSAVRMVHTARAHGMAVMLGCMLETNAAITAGAHLAPMLDYADLDGSLLLAADPFEGIPMPGGEISLDGVDRGTGARRRET